MYTVCLFKNVYNLIENLYIFLCRYSTLYTLNTYRSLKRPSMFSFGQTYIKTDKNETHQNFRK